MGEMGGDDFARGTARGIEAAAEERAAKAELVAQELGKEVAELRAALAARAANDQHTSPAPGEMGAQSGGGTGTGSEMGGSDTASTKTQSTETASPRTPDFFGEGEPTEASAATQTPALCLLGNLPGGVQGTAAEVAADLAANPTLRHALKSTRTVAQLQQAGMSTHLVALQYHGRPLVAFTLSDEGERYEAEMAVLHRVASLLGGTVFFVQAQYCAQEGTPVLEFAEQYVHEALQQVLGNEEQGWLDLAEIATLSASPGDEWVGSAIQHLVQGDDKQRGRAFAKLVLLTRNFAVGRHPLQETLANWATQAHFTHTAGCLVRKVEMAETTTPADATQQAAQQDGAAECSPVRKDVRTAQMLQEELWAESWARLSKSKRKAQRKRVQTTADRTEPIVSEVMGAQMVLVPVRGNGTCAMSAAAFVVTGCDAGDILISMVQEGLLMQEDLLELALADARAEREMPALTREEYLEHIRTGAQWSGQSELMVVALLLQIQIVVWAELDGVVHPHYLGGTPQQGQEAFTQVMHLYLKGGHYSPLVAAEAAQSGGSTQPPKYLITALPQDEGQTSRTPSPPQSATATMGSPRAHTMPTAGTTGQTQSVWGPPVTYPPAHAGAGAHAGSGGQGGQSAASDAGGRHAPVRNYRTQHRLQGIWKMMSSQNAEPPEGLLLKVVRREQGKVFRLTMQGAVEALLEVTPRFNESEIFLMAANERDSTFYGLEGHDQRRYDRERRALRGTRHLWEAIAQGHRVQEL